MTKEEFQKLKIGDYIIQKATLGMKADRLFVVCGVYDATFGRITAFDPKDLERYTYHLTQPSLYEKALMHPDPAKKPKFYILWNPSSKEPPQARYNTKEQAVAVARKMALQHAGEEFYVMEVYGVAYVEPQPKFTEY